MRCADFFAQTCVFGYARINTHTHTHTHVRLYVCAYCDKYIRCADFLEPTCVFRYVRGRIHTHTHKHTRVCMFYASDVLVFWNQHKYVRLHTHMCVYTCVLLWMHLH